MNKATMIKTVIVISTSIAMSSVIMIAIAGCSPAPCPEGTEDIGLGQCVPKDKDK
jgi:hypothetical protein